MKIEDCEVGMVVECQSNKYRNINKGDKLTISEVDIKEYNKSYIYFEESHSNYRAENFEPINKFEVGDEVLYKAENGINYECTIFGIAKQKDKFDGKYAISFVKGSGRVVNKIVKECKLSQLKKKDELEVGDKFKSNTGNEVEVLAVGKDEGKTYYLGKLKMGVLTFEANEIDGIIYN